MIDGNTFVTSDHHFGHDNISKHEPIRKQATYNNGFSRVDDMMVYKWSMAVKENDTVLHLGDFAFKHKDIASLSNMLPGNKILLLGNHDKANDVAALKENGWKIIDGIELNVEEVEAKKVLRKLQQNVDYQRMDKRLLCCYVDTVLDKRIMFTHFPLYNDNPYDEKYNEITKMLESIYEMLECELNIHGHTHSKGAKEPFCKSVCVELTDFEPVRLKTLLQGMDDV